MNGTISKKLSALKYLLEHQFDVQPQNGYNISIPYFNFAQHIFYYFCFFTRAPIFHQKIQKETESSYTKIGNCQGKFEDQSVSEELEDIFIYLTQYALTTFIGSMNQLIYYNCESAFKYICVIEMPHLQIAYAIFNHLTYSILQRPCCYLGNVATKAGFHLAQHRTSRFRCRCKESK